MQSVAEVGDSNAISLPSKPPKPGMLSTIPSSTKRESLGPNRMRPEKNNIEGPNNLNEGNFFVYLFLSFSLFA